MATENAASTLVTDRVGAVVHSAGSRAGVHCCVHDQTYPKVENPTV
jgi:hypothetical protein